MDEKEAEGSPAKGAKDSQHSVSMETKTTESTSAKSPVDSPMDSAPADKKRKIHMTSDSCQFLARSEDGQRALSAPMATNIKVQGDVNKGLYPRQKRQTCRNKPLNEEDDLSVLYVGAVDSPQKLSVESENTSPLKITSGFTSAANIHRLNSNSSLVEQPAVNPITFGKRKRESCVSENQKSIKSFFSVSPKKVKHSDEKYTVPEHNDEYQPQVIQYRSPCKMFSPIKKVQNSQSIYISDDSTSPRSSQENSSQKSQITGNAVVKQLFDGQKNYERMKNEGKKKQKTTKQKGGNSNFKKKPPANLNNVKHPSVEFLKQDPDELNSEDDDLIVTAETAGSRTFGLLGREQSDVKRPDVDHFATLPDEILEKIFCQLPVLDLCLTCNRVCRRWNNIIAAEKVRNNRICLA